MTMRLKAAAMLKKEVLGAAEAGDRAGVDEVGGQASDGNDGKCRPAARRVAPRAEWRQTVNQHWLQYRKMWSTVTGTAPLSTLDETLAGAPI
jgi:hypothetical protein